MNSTALEPISAVIPEVSAHDGKVITTSLAVANYFHKRHDHVLEKIRAIIADCAPAYHVPNFREVVRNVPGGDGAMRKMPMFELTRDAFVLIVMGFTGKKALQWKIDYINAFNKMEEELQRQHNSIFPFDADLFVQVREGKTVYVKQAREGEQFMCFDTFKEIAERAGYMIIHCDDLKDITLDGLISIGTTAKSTKKLWHEKRLPR